MTDRELLYIKTIAEEHNITRAAEKLSIAQPSLTQSVQRIEKSLNCSLFHRQKNGFFLTSDGELYYKTACQMLELWNQLLNQLSDRDNMNGGVLNIGASWYNTLLILTPLLPKYRKNYPLIDIRLSEQKTSELVQLLNSGETGSDPIASVSKRIPGQNSHKFQKVGGKNPVKRTFLYCPSFEIWLFIRIARFRTTNSSFGDSEKYSHDPFQ